MSRRGRPRKYPPIDRLWLRTLIKAILSLFAEALRNNDDTMIRAIQACESTVWMKTRPGQSVVSCLINSTLDKMDLSDAEKRFAHNIRLDIEDDLLPWLGGLSRKWVVKTLDALLEHGLIKRYREVEDEMLGEYTTKISLTRGWDRLLKSMKEEGKARTVYTESLGKMIALATLEEGVSSLIPVVRIINVARSHGGSITDEQTLNICMAYGRKYRRYTDMIAHDHNKPEDIQLFSKGVGSSRRVNQIVFRMWDRWREIALELWRKRV